MVRFIKVVNTLDKVTDCIPIVSTMKNAGILLYQLIHKVNKVANPVKTSWTDDIKIHVLSKDNFMAGIASIPVVGNLTCLIVYVKLAIAKVTDDFIIGGPKGYLAESSRGWHYGTKKHSYEITALYLARNPNRQEHKHAKSLCFAASTENEEVFKLILNSRHWTFESLKNTLMDTHNINNANLILDQYKNALTNKNKEMGEVLRSHCFWYGESHYPIIEFLVSNFPQMDVSCVGQALTRLAQYRNTLKPISLLLTKFPGIDEKDMKEVLLKASEKNNGKIFELIEQHTPGIVGKNLDQVLKDASKNHDFSTFNWLSAKYKEKITPEQIGMVLTEQASPIYFGENDNSLRIINEILSTYPNLPAECLVPVMEKAANHNNDLFNRYLNTFSQLEPKHLQGILNDAVYVHGNNDDFSGFTERWKQVAVLIQSKFPKMKAENPYS